MRSIFLYSRFDRKPQISRISVELFVASNNLIVLNYEKVVGHFFEFKSQDNNKKKFDVLFGADDFPGAKSKSCSWFCEQVQMPWIT